MGCCWVPGGSGALWVPCLEHLWVLCLLVGVQHGFCMWTFGEGALTPALPWAVLFPVPLEDAT